MKSGYLKGSPTCPRCNTLIKGWMATNETGEGGPREGDVTVCIYCQAVLQVKNSGYILAPAEVVIEVTYELSRIQNIIKEIKEKKL